MRDIIEFFPVFWGIAFSWLVFFVLIGLFVKIFFKEEVKMKENKEQANGLYLNVKVIIDDDEFNRKKERITKLIQEAQRELDTLSDVIEVRI